MWSKLGNRLEIGTPSNKKKNPEGGIITRNKNFIQKENTVEDFIVHIHGPITKKIMFN